MAHNCAKGGGNHFVLIQQNNIYIYFLQLREKAACALKACLNVIARAALAGFITYYISHNSQRHELTSRVVARVVSIVESGSLLECCLYWVYMYMYNFLKNPVNLLFVSALSP